MTTPLLFDPGERCNYGINLDFVGKIVEAVTGQRLGQYMQENLLEPLGMRDTAFKIRSDMRARLASVHMRQQDGSLEPLAFEIPQEPEFEMGGGGLYGTVADYARFIRMVPNKGRADGGQVLKAETVGLMCRHAIGELRVRRLKTVLPQYSPQYSNDAEFFRAYPKAGRSSGR